MIGHRNEENYDNQRFQLYPPNVSSSHDRRDVTRPNNRNVTVIPETRKKHKGDENFRHKFVDSTLERRIDEDLKRKETLIATEDLEMRIVTQRETPKETQRRSPVQGD